jgi:hypothetical protein
LVVGIIGKYKTDMVAHPVSSALGKLRNECCEFKTSLVYLEIV